MLFPSNVDSCDERFGEEFWDSNIPMFLSLLTIGMEDSCLSRLILGVEKVKAWNGNSVNAKLDI